MAFNAEGTKSYEDLRVFIVYLKTGGAVHVEADAIEFKNSVPTEQKRLTFYVTNQGTREPIARFVDPAGFAVLPDGINYGPHPYDIPERDPKVNCGES